MTMQNQNGRCQLVRNSFFTMLILFSVLCYSQDFGDFDSNEVENSPSYYCGKGRSTQESKAIELARADLSEKIVLFLYSSKQVQTISTESGGEVTQTDYINSYTKIFSALHLTGIEKKVVSTDYGYACWVYISKENWEKSLSELAEKVENLINAGESEFESGNLNHAVSLFYKAYLLSYTSPKELYFKGKNHSLRGYAESALQKIIQGISLTSGKPLPNPGDDMMTILSLQVKTTGGGHANNLNIFSEAEQNWNEVVDGSLRITMDLPKLPYQQVNFEIKPVFRGEDYLVEIDARYPLKFMKKVDVDFSDLIKIDFMGRIKNGVLSCETVAEYLNVVDVDWYYADGLKYNGTFLKTDAGNRSSITVKMKVNNSDDLVVVKTLDNPDFIQPPKKEKIEEVKKDPPPEPKVDKPDINNTQKENKPDPVILLDKKSENILMEIQAVKDDIKQLLSLLNSKKESGLLIYGNRKDFTDPVSCFIIVYNESTGITEAILSPGKDKRKNLLTGEFVEDLANKFKGKRSIWFQIL